MKLIIDIDENDYKFSKQCVKSGVGSKADKFIANGIPLPKGHGRLIDADNFSTDCGIRAIDCPGNCDKCSDCVVKYEDIRNAKTIVDADKESNNEADN